MAKPKKHGALSIRKASAIISSTPISSADPTPSSSTYPSAYPSEDEGGKGTKNLPSFPFMALPSELRNRVYHLVFNDVPPVMDLDPTTFSYLNRTKALALFRVSRQLHQETHYYFFSTHTFRIFPTFHGKYFKTKKPLLARLPSKYRASITSLQLRLGPGWNNPPRGWVVNDALGLADCTNVRVLKVFVECDPSDVIFNGFRAYDGFYEQFSAGLLDEILKGIPSVEVVEFDAYSSVMRTGDMMSGLGAVVTKYNKVVAWGPERGWQEETEQVWLDTILLHSESNKKLCKSVAVLA